MDHQHKAVWIVAVVAIVVLGMVAISVIFSILALAGAKARGALAQPDYSSSLQRTIDVQDLQPTVNPQEGR